MIKHIILLGIILTFCAPVYSAFVHPGVAHSKAELDFVRQKIEAEEQPWKDAYEKMKSSKYANLSWNPEPYEKVERGAYNKPDIGSSELLGDGSASYTHALLWCITGNQDHAQKVRQILNAWSAELRIVTNHDAKLLVGMTGHHYCNAAELIKHTWDGWPVEEQESFASMLRDVFYPIIEDFFPAANGNWDASMIQTMMAMGVFLDDRAMFNRAVAYFLEGKGNGAITMYFNDFGECQESGRDQTHTQMGLEYLGNSAEIAWKQGIDLYGAVDNRLALGYEYTAKYNLGESVPYEPYISYNGKYRNKTISSSKRGRFRPIYEKVYNHYHNRMGMEMPYTKRVIHKTRPENGGGASLPWGTLMFAQQPQDLVVSTKLDSHNKVNVSSLKELSQAVQKSNQHIVMQPGNYEVKDPTSFHLSGSNNYIDLSGVYIEVPLSTVSGNLFRLTGNNITLRGGTLEDTYPGGMTEVTDFGSYNHTKKYGGMNEMVVSGNDIKIIGIKMTVRGSFPYGYGNMYGIGRGNVTGLKKHCGIQITGDRAVIDSCNIKMEAFGHVIYMQGGDKTTIRNTVIEGSVRPSNDLYNEKNDGDLAKKYNYQLQWPDQVKGLPIPRDHMLNLTEDGIRAYRGAGDIIVENCIVKKTRGGIKLYMAKSAVVTNCQVMDCIVEGYSLPSGGTVINSSGNAAYGPLLYMHFDSHSNQKIDLKVFPSPHGIGDHVLAAIRGGGHSINFTPVGSPTTESPRPIVVGYYLRFDFLSTDYPGVPAGYESRYNQYKSDSYKASNINITNGTAHPVVLGELSRDNHITSDGPIKDYGTNNIIKTIVSLN